MLEQQVFPFWRLRIRLLDRELFAGDILPIGTTVVS